MLKGINALDKWLSRSTWYTSHAIDEEIFYKAVKSIIDNNPGSLLHENEITNYITISQQGKIAADYLSVSAKKYGEKAELISDYVLKTN